MPEDALRDEVYRRIAESGCDRQWRVSVRGAVVVGFVRLRPRYFPGTSQKVEIFSGWFSRVVRLVDIQSVEPEFSEYEARNERELRFRAAAIEAALCSVDEPNRTGPQPKVGAVLVVDGAQRGIAWRGKAGPGIHAEHALIDHISRHPSELSGATLYTTLEPCTRRGPTEIPCANRILDSRIDRVVIGMLDPNPNIRGEGVWRLRDAGINVSLFERAEMAQIEAMNREFTRHWRPASNTLVETR